MARPHARRGLQVGEKKRSKEGWLIPVTCIGVVLVASLLAVTWVLGCPASPLTASPSHFLPPLAGSCFKASLDRSGSSCRDVSKQGPQGSPARELVTGNSMACSIAGQPRNCPSGIIAHRQIWQLSPRLKHGRVESIDQLAQYHTQIDTPMEWCHQFCSGETRLDRYAVYPKWLALWFGKPKKQSCSVEYLSFLICVILDLICWYPICHAFNHRMEGVSPLVFSISAIDLWRHLVLLAPYLLDVILPPWPCGHKAASASGPPK